eukprot:TRINITY_DN4137_c0_g4_i1.p1 TRINITY_DN4137_c0_g4~~TRINITY_DN4137_c0_g4_i1.p1  ORF type:complete len:317 (-),score=76.44 TRINITY_DN4137_c0_g4_i1:116-1066(-)
MEITADVEVPKLGETIEVEWPCEASDGLETKRMWFKVFIVSVQEEKRTPKFLLRFDDGEEAWNSLRKLSWRRFDDVDAAAGGGAAAVVATAVAADGDVGVAEGGGVAIGVTFHSEEEQKDSSGFVHEFTIEDELVCFCDELHERREEFGDKTRGNTAYGEPLSGGLISVLIRRDALPPRERDLYHRLHQRCIAEVPKAWPTWLRKAGGKDCRARPSQDLRLLQYSEGANFKAHVDSGWACQALVYLNEDFNGGFTKFPNLGAKYRPRRGRVLLWRSVCVGHKAAVPGSLDDHPALHVAGEVSDGTKRVVSVNLVLA